MKCILRTLVLAVLCVVGISMNSAMGASTVHASDAPLVNTTCTLTGRIASGDGRFHMGGDAQEDASAFDVTCLLTSDGEDGFTGMAKIVAYLGGEEGQGELIGAGPVTFTPPARSVSVSAQSTLPAGDHELVVSFEDAAGTPRAYESRIPVSIAEIPSEVAVVRETGELVNAGGSSDGGYFGNVFLWTGILGLFAVLMVLFLSRGYLSSNLFGESPSNTIPKLLIALTLFGMSAFVGVGSVEAGSTNFMLTHICFGTSCPRDTTVYYNVYTDKNTYTLGETINVELHISSDDSPQGFCPYFNLGINGANYTGDLVPGCYTAEDFRNLVTIPVSISAPSTAGPFNLSVSVGLNGYQTPAVKNIALTVSPPPPCNWPGGNVGPWDSKGCDAYVGNTNVTVGNNFGPLSNTVPGLSGSITYQCTTSGFSPISVSCNYVCGGAVPANASLCSGDSSGLTAMTSNTVVNSCTPATKCEYTCNGGYTMSGGACVPTAPPQCSDGIDNDGDGLVDLGDPGCTGSGDTDESPPNYACTGTTPSNANLCSGDDTGLSANTPKTVVSSCTAVKCEYTCASGYTKSGNTCVPTAPPQCSDGIDNDGDGLIDQGDPGCTGSGGTGESPPNYFCTGITPSNANLCSGDDTGLSANTPKTVVSSCAAPKCEYTCGSGYTKSGNTCVPTGVSITASIAASNCTILLGASSCSSTVSWSSSGATSPSVRQDGTQFSTASNNPGISRTIGYGTHTFEFYNTGTLIDSDSANASCISGTSWNGSVCAATGASGSLTVSSCTIASGQSTCSGNVSWTLSGATSPRVYQESTQFSTSATGNTSRTLQYGSNNFSLYNGGTLIDAKVGNASCISGTSWNGSVCAATGASGSLTVSSCTIASGQSTCSGNVSWTLSGATSPRVYQESTQFSTSATGNTSRTLQYGSNNFSLYNSGTLIDAKVGNASCVSGTSWNGSVCAVGSGGTISFSNNGPITPGTRATLAYTVSGWDTCSILRIPENTSLGGSFSGNLGPGSRLSDVLTSTKTYRLTCTSSVYGTDSRDTTVVVSPVGTTISVSAGSCTIPAGQSSCTVNVSWTNATTPTSVKYTYTNTIGTTYNGTEIISAYTSGNTDHAVYHGSNNVFWNDAGGGVANPAYFVTALCASGSAWNGTECSSSDTASAPTLTFIASPLSIIPGNPSTLTWTVNGVADTCTATGGWSGTKASGGGSHMESVAPVVTTTYSLECWNGSASSGKKDVTIAVQTPTGNIYANGAGNSVTVSSGDTVTLTWNSQNASACTVVSSPQNGSDSWSGVNNSVGVVTSPITTYTNYILACDSILVDAVAVNVGPGSGPKLTPSTPIIEQGGTVTLSWDTNGPDENTCTLTGGTIGSTYTPIPLSGNPTRGSLGTIVTGRTTYTLDCGGLVSVVTVEVIPRLFEQ